VTNLSLMAGLNFLPENLNWPKENSMSKKHFESLAKYIRAIMDPHARLQAACAVASSCAEMNPRFDTQKFFEACGV
jgi:hypothetical protein